MSLGLQVIRQYPAQLLALIVIAGALWWTRLPKAPTQSRHEAAQAFRFERHRLETVDDGAARSVRDVHPSLSHIRGWISSVGASVALRDVDGDGLPNDVCYVDARYNAVVVTSAPGSGERYHTFSLDPSYETDPNTVAPMGCLPGDLNEDGYTDLVVYYWGQDPNAYLQLSDDLGALSRSSFTVVDLVDGHHRWYTNAMTRADLNGDGHADLVVGNYFADGARILDADAGGTAHMPHSLSRAKNGGHNRALLWQSATSGNLLATVQDQPFQPVSTGPAEQVSNLGLKGPAVEFTCVTPWPEEIMGGWTLALGAADLDGDLLPEIYVANDFGPDALLHNRSENGNVAFATTYGRDGLTTPSSKVLGQDSFKGMGTDFGDVNLDGHLDIYVSNIAARFALEESHFLWLSTGEPEALASGRAPYREASERLGLSRSDWSWESRLEDFNNDGVLEAYQATGFLKGTTDRWPELHELAMGNDEVLAHPSVWPRFAEGDDLSGHVPNAFFVRVDERYHDVAPEIGLADSTVTRGIATGDVDGDGDLDVALANQWEPSFFYENRLGDSNRSVVLRPCLRQPPSETVRARLLDPMDRPTCRTPALVTGRLQRRGRPAIPRQLDLGNGHSGTRSAQLHWGFGEGPKSTERTIRLGWRGPNGTSYRDTVRVQPGRHTVLLGWRPERSGGAE